MSRIKFMTTSCEIANTVNATEHLWSQVNNGSGNGLLPSDKKP